MSLLCSCACRPSDCPACRRCRQYLVMRNLFSGSVGEAGLVMQQVRSGARHFGRRRPKARDCKSGPASNVLLRVTVLHSSFPSCAAHVPPACNARAAQAPLASPPPGLPARYRTLSEFGRIGPEFDQVWPDSGQVGPMFDSLWPKFARIQPYLPESGRMWLEFDAHRPKLAEFGQISAKVDQIWSTPGKRRMMLVTFRPFVRPTLAQIRVAQIGHCLAESGPKPAKLGQISVREDRPWGCERRLRDT